MPEEAVIVQKVIGDSFPEIEIGIDLNEGVCASPPGCSVPKGGVVVVLAIPLGADKFRFFREICQALDVAGVGIAQTNKKLVDLVFEED